MSLMPFDPFQELASIRESMNRMFEDFFGRRGTLPALSEEGLWQPAVDVIEKDNEIIVKANIPGVDPKNVEVNVTDDAVSIKGEMKEDKEEEGANYYRRERYYGSFRRVVPLGVKVKADEAKARFKNGTLEIIIPKAEEAKGKTLTIEAE